MKEMMNHCVEIWVENIKGNCCRYLTTTANEVEKSIGEIQQNTEGKTPVIFFSFFLMLFLQITIAWSRGCYNTQTHKLMLRHTANTFNNTKHQLHNENVSPSIPKIVFCQQLRL